MHNVRLIYATLLVAVCGVAHAEDMPSVPEGFRVSVFAREPMVRNPCAMAFDRRGRLYVSQGRQYRNPQPDTRGDRVSILVDSDGDGVAETSTTFAEGFNHIQDLAWRGDELWVAAAPELVVVRDTDDVADEYEILYGGLGNLEHALHGLNFAPDGWVYMSKGNSKGYADASSPEKRVAPKAFLDLWGLTPPPGAAEMPEPEVFNSAEAFARARGYHTPSDDWGAEGGVLRCDRDGRNLEIVSRGCRNPWDITFDEHFNWLGTDQDQDGGDRIIRPFYGAHFGWGHKWSPHWTGEGHLPSVPISGPTFHGSGTGVIYCTSPRFPAKYRGVFFVNDWLKRHTVVYRPKWDGAMMRNMDEPEVFASAPKGRAMGSSSGMLYDVVDMEVGPDGALWVLSWGHGYGATIKNGKQVDAGRVYRIGYGDHPHYRIEAHRATPVARWSVTQLIDDLRHDALPVWRIDAADELVRRGAAVRDTLIAALRRKGQPAGAVTWIIWTLGRLDASDATIDALLADRARTGPVADRVQALRVLGDRARRSGTLHGVVVEALGDTEPRVRFAAVQAIHEARRTDALNEVWKLVATEADRATFYAAWRALGDLSDEPALRARLKNERGGVRRAGLLALLERAELSGDEALPLRLDEDRAVAELASSFLEKVGTSAEPVLSIEPVDKASAPSARVRIVSRAKGLRPRYTLDGSEPTDTTGKDYRDPLTIEDGTTIRAALFRQRVRVGPVVQWTCCVTDARRGAIAGDHLSVSDVAPVSVDKVEAASGQAYRLLASGLRTGKAVYTNRTYTWTDVPAELAGATVIQPANSDADVGSRGERFLRFYIAENADVYVAHDRRIKDKPEWLSAFDKTELTLRSQDATYDVFGKRVGAGEVSLGGNTRDGRPGGRSQYVVVVTPAPRATPTTIDDVITVIAQGDAVRGRRLFFGAATCGNCHRVGDHGSAFAPDLSDLHTRGDHRAIAEAILDPSATITEGYQGLAVVRHDGKSHFGFIRKESGLVLELVQADGQPVSIPKSQIKSRRRVDASVMPAAYQHTLSPLHVADLIAFLTAAQKAPRTTPEAMVDLATPVVGTRWGDADNGFHLTMREGAVDIVLDGESIASYVFRDDKTLRPYFAHVKTPRGVQVTRNHPPVKGRDPDDHPAIHPGLWLGFANLNGVSYWHNQDGRVTHQGFTQAPRVERDVASFATLDHYVAHGKVVCEQSTRYTLRRDPAGYRIDIDAAFRSDRGFYFGVKEEMGLGIRVASAIRVKGGNGTILSTSGGRNERGTWGKHDRWWDYAGEIANRSVGMTIFSAPGNPEVWAHSRDYGVLVANPFPVDVPQNRQAITVVKPDETFRLRFGVLVHEADRQKAYDPASAYRRYVESQD